ncbi:MAG: hypothetical protein M0Z31_07225 [Clostridia bacterium]|nr:hypothetical protein [Clostridia bacterium]
MDGKIDKYLNKDKWYHGTTLYNWKRLCLLGVKADYNIGNELDFGYGFYLTPEKKQAEYYIENLLNYTIEGDFGLPLKNIADKKTPIIIEFTFHPLEWYINQRYTFKFFNKYDDKLLLITLVDGNIGTENDGGDSRLSPTPFRRFSFVQ